MKRKMAGATGGIIGFWKREEAEPGPATS